MPREVSDVSIRNSISVRLGGLFALCLAAGIGLTLATSLVVSNRHSEDQTADVARFVALERDTQSDILNHTL